METGDGPRPSRAAEPGSILTSISCRIGSTSRRWRRRQVLQWNGSLLFLINPAGTRLDIHDQDSGEQSLRMLAGESGGRYYDGPEEEIAKEIAGMESAYYEISFPDPADFPGFGDGFRDPSAGLRTRNPYRQENFRGARSTAR